MPKPLPHHWRKLTRSQIVECARRRSNHSHNYNTSILELLKIVHKSTSLFHYDILSDLFFFKYPLAIMISIPCVDNVMPYQSS